MRKIIAVLIMLTLLVASYVYFSKVNDKIDVEAVSQVAYSENNLLSEIKENYEDNVLKIRKLQENPDQIAEFNCLVTKVLYSGKLQDEDIKLLLKFQREYYTEETLNNNPEEVNYQALLTELKEYKAEDLGIIGYKIIGHQYVDVEDNEKKMLIFNVIYYLNITTEDGEVYKGYIFEQNKDKLWELKGFGPKKVI